MDELKKAINDSKKSINRIKCDLDRYRIDILQMPDWEEIIETLTYLQGYLTCMEKHNL